MEKSDRKQYKITDISKKIRVGQQPSIKQSSSVVTLEVAEKTDDRILLHWTMGAKVATDPAINRDPLAKRVNKTYDGLVLQMEIDKDGVYLGIDNWDEIDKANQKMIDIIKETLATIQLPEGAKQKILNEAMRKGGSREAIESKFTAPLAMMINPTNRFYLQTGVSKHEEEVPYLGVDIAAQATETTTNVNETSQTLTWNYTRELNTDKLVKLTEQDTIRKLRSLGRTPPEPGFFENVEIKTTASYQYNYETGWPQKINVRQSVIIDDSTNVKQTIIEQVMK